MFSVNKKEKNLILIAGLCWEVNCDEADMLHAHKPDLHATRPQPSLSASLHEGKLFAVLALKVDSGHRL